MRVHHIEPQVPTHGCESAQSTQMIRPARRLSLSTSNSCAGRPVRLVRYVASSSFHSLRCVFCGACSDAMPIRRRREVSRASADFDSCEPVFFSRRDPSSRSSHIVLLRSGVLEKFISKRIARVTRFCTCGECGKKWKTISKTHRGGAGTHTGRIHTGTGLTGK